MPRGMKPGTSIHRVDRYAAVKLRQRIREELLQAPDVTYHRLFPKFLINGWLPKKSNGEPLEDFGFRRQFLTVKQDLNHHFEDFFLCFLHRAVVDAYKDFHKRGKAPRAYNGMREISSMTGLQETTIRDILILNGEIK